MNYSLDDEDNFSNISRISCGLHNSLNSTCNSDSECSGPVSVRDMIQHYNKQFTKGESFDIKPRNTYKVNTAKKYHHPSQHLLAATKSSYCGLNNYGSCPNCKHFVDQNENDNRSHNQTANICCKSFTSCACCQSRSRINSATTKLLSSTSSSYLLLQPHENNKKPPSSSFTTYNFGCENCLRNSNTNLNKINAKDTRILAVENCSNINAGIDGGVVGVGGGAGADINVDATSATIFKPAILNNFCAELNRDSSTDLFKNHNSQIELEKKQNSLLLTDSVEEANICQPSANETSYQSKTTIAKTSSGVRIIIDIFFDQEQSPNATDIVGSRVETDIPHSRILTEFQQQTKSVNAGAAEVASNSF